MKIPLPKGNGDPILAAARTRQSQQDEDTVPCLGIFSLLQRAWTQGRSGKSTLDAAKCGSQAEQLPSCTSTCPAPYHISACSLSMEPDVTSDTSIHRTVTVSNCRIEFPSNRRSADGCVVTSPVEDRQAFMQGVNASRLSEGGNSAHRPGLTRPARPSETRIPGHAPGYRLTASLDAIPSFRTVSSKSLRKSQVAPVTASALCTSPLHPLASHTPAGSQWMSSSFSNESALPLEELSAYLPGCTCGLDQIGTSVSGRSGKPDCTSGLIPNRLSRTLDGSAFSQGSSTHHQKCATFSDCGSCAPAPALLSVSSLPTSGSRDQHRDNNASKVHCMLGPKLAASRGLQLVLGRGVVKRQHSSEVPSSQQPRQRGALTKMETAATRSARALSLGGEREVRSAMQHVRSASMQITSASSPGAAQQKWESAVATRSAFAAPEDGPGSPPCPGTVAVKDAALHQHCLGTVPPSLRHSRLRIASLPEITLN